MAKVTIAELQEKVTVQDVKLTVMQNKIDEMTKRTGCPKGFMPVYKLAYHNGVSESLIKYVIDKYPRIAKRVYSTKEGGQIINCKAYSVKSIGTNLLAVKRKLKPVGTGVYSRDAEGRAFKV